jgi:catechol 2,3-dioxygenase-like lactoylglutathione lyase family enzyme
VGIVVDDLGETIDFFRELGLEPEGRTQSKENGPDVSLGWAISASRLP